MLSRDSGAPPELVVELRELTVRGLEGRRIRVADPRDDVPVIAGPARQRERRTRRDGVQAPLRVEHVPERQKVPLVRTTAVVQDEQALRRAVRSALSKRELPLPSGCQSPSGFRSAFFPSNAKNRRSVMRNV